MRWITSGFVAWEIIQIAVSLVICNAFQAFSRYKDIHLTVFGGPNVIFHVICGSEITVCFREISIPMKLPRQILKVCRLAEFVTKHWFLQASRAARFV